jgi:hypothetical protein
VLGEQSGDDLTAPLLAVSKAFNQPIEGVVDGHVQQWAAALLRISSRQLRCSAICWNAGFNIAAWESPNRATVVGEGCRPGARSPT